MISIQINLCGNHILHQIAVICHLVSILVSDCKFLSPGFARGVRVTAVVSVIFSVRDS